MKSMVYRVQKRLEGYSTCFRQWQATSHCRYLHGYDLAFVLYFKATTLDRCHWVWDFGWLDDQRYLLEDKTVRQWFNYMFDHTVFIADEDPHLNDFTVLAEKDLIQLRQIPAYSTEKVAELVLDTLSILVTTISKERVSLYRVDVLENHMNLASAELATCP